MEISLQLAAFGLWRMKSDSIRELIASVGKAMLDQWLTDLAGGNISIRSDQTIFITPRYAGTRWRWQLNPEDIVEGRLGDEDFEHGNAVSREAPVHFSIYRTFPSVKAIIHAHPYHVMPFCVAEKALEPLIEKAELFGTVPLVRWAEANSQELADSIVEGLEKQRDRLEKNAAVVLMPKHGLLIAAVDLDEALYALNKIDRNAWCILCRPLVDQYRHPG
jgi:L-fuculose-phosphate aldolase